MKQRENQIRMYSKGRVIMLHDLKSLKGRAEFLLFARNSSHQLLRPDMNLHDNKESRRNVLKITQFPLSPSIVKKEEGVITEHIICIHILFNDILPQVSLPFSAAWRLFGSSLRRHLMANQYYHSRPLYF